MNVTLQFRNANGTETAVSATTPLPVSAPGTGPVAVKDGGQPYENVAVSQTDQVLGGAGALGDVLAAIWVESGATPTDVIVKDGGTEIFRAKAASLTANGTNVFYPGIASMIGPFTVTTGAGSKALCIGAFSA